MSEDASSQVDEVLDLVAEFMEATLDALDVDPDTEVDLRYEDGAIFADLDGDEDDIALMIGRRGQTLDAMQYLLNAVVQNNAEAPLHVQLDAQGYRKRRARQLEKDADQAVAEVHRTGRRIELEPMTSSERKVIHQYLKDSPGIATISAGREPNRRLAVEPAGD
ncbi:MAG: single-stranded nucleic acid binding domain protein [Thermoleophilia bacterium]|nr:single-stranded nucleic acid binding domain protein [Thermoleophilia bacterium]